MAEDAGSGRGKSRWSGYRSRHRQKSHDDAHAFAHEAAVPVVLDHPLVPQGEPEMVTTADALRDVIAHVREAGRFGYDSEFIGEHTYYPNLCVIQVSTAERVFLIDPLIIGKSRFSHRDGAKGNTDELKPFWELLADESVEKIVHAGQQDLEPVVRHLGRVPRGVYDTQIAAGFAGFAYPMALGKLVAAMTNADLGHGLKFSQWDRRPLSHVQMQYAANDVRYLPLLHACLTEKLSDTGMLDWARQEFASLSDSSLYVFDAAKQRVRVRGAESLTPRQQAILRALLALREEAAAKENAPPRALLKDGILVFMAKSPMRSLADLDGVRGLPRPFKRMYGEAILRETKAILELQMPNGSDAQPAPESVEHRNRVEEVWQMVQERCAQVGIAPSLVTSKKELSGCLRSLMAGPASLPDSRLCQGWRHELLLPVCDFLRR